MADVERFLDLFQGRPDAMGGDEGRAIYKPVNIQAIQKHLDGTTPMGVYPVRFVVSEGTEEWSDDMLRNNMWVKWGCGDIDTGDWSEAYNLASALRAMGLKPWVERSRSKGWHIWIFSDKWVHAWVMRRCFKVAYQAIGLQAKEANPKSEILRPNQLGNYVRLGMKGGFDELKTLDEREYCLACWPVGGGGFFPYSEAERQTRWCDRLPPNDGPGCRSSFCPNCGGQVGYHGQQGKALPWEGMEGYLRLANPAERRGDGSHVGDLPFHGRTSSGTDSDSFRSMAVERGPVGQASSLRQVFTIGWSAEGDGLPLTLTEFLACDIVSDRNIIAKWAAKWYEPPRPKIQVRIVDETEFKMLLDSLPANLRTLYENGPKSGDTSQGLQALGHNLAQQGWKPDDVYTIVAMADQKWGKYASERRNPEDYYRDIIDRSYNG